MLKRIIVGLMAASFVLGGILLVPAAQTSAASTTVLLATVKESAKVASEYVEISNNTTAAITMTGWQVCTSKVCDSFTRDLKASLTVRIGSAELKNWTQSGGLNQEADLVCIVDDKGAVVDCINWGVVNTNWPNFAKFNTAGPLSSPGLTVPTSASSQDLLIFRTRTTQTQDNDKLDQWVIRLQGSSTPPTTTASPTPSGSAAPSQGGVGSTVPQTGAEFPIIVVLVLIVLLFGVRYLRSTRTVRR